MNRICIPAAVFERCWSRVNLQYATAMNWADPPASVLLPLSDRWGQIMLQERLQFSAREVRVNGAYIGLRGTARAPHPQLDPINQDVLGCGL